MIRFFVFITTDNPAAFPSNAHIETIAAAA